MNIVEQIMIEELISGLVSSFTPEQKAMAIAKSADGFKMLDKLPEDKLIVLYKGTYEDSEESTVWLIMTDIENVDISEEKKEIKPIDLGTIIKSAVSKLQ